LSPEQEGKPGRGDADDGEMIAYQPPTTRDPRSLARIGAVNPTQGRGTARVDYTEVGNPSPDLAAYGTGLAISVPPAPYGPHPASKCVPVELRP